MQIFFMWPRWFTGKGGKGFGLEPEVDTSDGRGEGTPSLGSFLLF